ncbi:YwbE family protein [Sporosarcina sp. UB5]|uniref:YwbE family protein n=1 Tax=Sporosarcina sp. UB5 TaxID=3047463 RepID=UPI003D7A6703
MDGRNRSDVKPGMKVAVILKKDQRSGVKTEGIVKDLLTNSSFHPHGIKVRLEDGQVGRVSDILG